MSRMQKSNNPEDLQEGTEKVGAGNAQNVFRQGFIPNQEQAQKCVVFFSLQTALCVRHSLTTVTHSLEAPQSRDQLRASAAELNESAHKSSNARP